MPKFPPADTILDREQAINAILTSIAMEEVALSRLIDAENEKIRYALKCAKEQGCNCTSMQNILAINKSAHSMIALVSDVQILLKQKMTQALNHLPDAPVPPCPPKPPPCPPKPPIPPTPSKKPCIKRFIAETAYDWNCHKTLFFNDACGCDNGAKLCNLNCASRIVLPSCINYEVTLNIKLINPSNTPIVLELIQSNGGKPISVKQVTSGAKATHIQHTEMYAASSKYTKTDITVKLVSPQKLRILDGGIIVKD